jgi:diguanylate cyclase (GGDEF)-like protein/PAS domain S-box-containing protein
MATGRGEDPVAQSVSGPVDLLESDAEFKAARSGAAISVDEGGGATPAILVVDDNASKRLSIKAVLAPLGHRVVEAESGEAALHLVIAESFAVILMDVQMPGIDGYETARLVRMRAASEHTLVVFITAGASNESEVPLAYANGAVDFIFGTIVPTTLRAKVSFFVELFLKSRDLERSLSEVRDGEAHTRAVLASVADGIVTINEDGVIESFNRAATEMFGYSEAEAIGLGFSIMVDPNLDPVPVSPEQGSVRPPIAGGAPGGRWTEASGTRRNGSVFPIELALSSVSLGERRIQIGCVRDLSEREAYTEALKHQALHDSLTGLPNRLLFSDRVNHGIHVAIRNKDSLALLVMDLDEFKQVNDTIGHHVGDALLKLVGARLTACVREGDTVARLGGDEFGLLLLSTDLPGAATVAWKIEQALEPPFVIDGHAIDVRASVGITLVPEHGDNIDDLLRRADLAMYDAKRVGGGHALFAAVKEESATRRLALLRDLRQCVANDELVLHYQPKIDLATSRITGVEALIRWNHPSDGFLRPAQFMPEVENSELMLPITMWVINEALRQLRIWRDQGYDLTMAVNLDAACLRHGAGLLEDVDEMNRRWDIPPQRLTFELTESALIDTDVPELLARLEGVDQQLSIDDFGTGYSSLIYLQRLPVTEIKADRSFVTTMASATDNAVIVRAIIDLSHNLSRKVVAEGVEDQATMDLLIAFGCDSAQGYHFSHPISAADMGVWLETSPFGMPSRDVGAIPAISGRASGS